MRRRRRVSLKPSMPRELEQWFLDRLHDRTDEQRDLSKLTLTELERFGAWLRAEVDAGREMWRLRLQQVREEWRRRHSGRGGVRRRLA